MIKEYFKELKNLQIYEKENSFTLFRIQGKILYIHDMYVKPEFRRTGVAYEMADELIEVAKDCGCTHVLADVEPSNINSTASIKFILNYGGFTLKQANDNEIILIKEIT